MRALAVALALMPGAAMAGCAEERAFVLGLIGANGWTVADSGRFIDQAGTCRVRGLALTEATLRLDIGMIEWRLEGLDGLASGVGTVSISAAMDNLRMTPEVEDPWIGYMLAQQNRRNLIDATLEAMWGLEDGRVELVGLDVDLPGDNAFELAFRASGLTPATLAGQMSDLAKVEVVSIAARIENTGFADGLILGMLIGQMSGVPGSPETVIAGTKAEVQALIGTFPDEIFAEGSKAALVRLIGDAPVPWGAVRASVVADPALPLARFLALAPDPLAPETLRTAFEGAEVTVEYEAETGAE